MGLWNFIKRLFSLALALMWNLISESFSPERSQKSRFREGGHARSYFPHPAYGSPFAPKHNPGSYGGIPESGRYEEMCPFGSRAWNRGTVYSSAYSRDNLGGYPRTGFDAYSISPGYKSKMENLYDYDFPVYGSGKSRSGKKGVPYSRAEAYE